MCLLLVMLLVLCRFVCVGLLRCVVVCAWRVGLRSVFAFCDCVVCVCRFVFAGSFGVRVLFGVFEVCAFQVCSCLWLLLLCGI